MKILAVDDDPIILELLTEVLRVVGFTDVTICESAKEAIETITQSEVPFDCFLCDIQMPEMDGIQLTSAIRKLPEYVSTPILMITAMSDRSYIDNAFAAGATDYVTKPFEIAEVHARMRLFSERDAERKLLEDRNPVPTPGHPAGTVTQAELAARITPSDVTGFIDYLALENYLLQFSRISLFGMRAFGVVVPELARAYEASSAYEYHATITDFAEAISDCLKSRGFFASHAGAGEFVCVLTDGSAFDPIEFEKQLCDTVREMDLHYCDGRPMTLLPVVGGTKGFQLKSAQEAPKILVQALSDAEMIARDPHAATREALPGPLQRLFAS
ncbi:response regulator [Pseudohalocynthiibacter aestuariivivens]|uniref:Response regulator n=1 Tax=Roseovarius pelagicus TaxID=2980108 RepID=A0ABY6DAE0_9RHOB|nr:MULTISPECIES: response regulator [Rhodobacterales]QIE45549.1 response regulator [Pseudohalocynthiibacter aestuariivivens]UXX82530.1 response regulator [Roseovarius pelagicus]